MKLALIVAAAAMLSFGAARAADPSVPATGSEQGITVPHATPGMPTHAHDAKAEGHLTAPTGQTPRSAEGGYVPSNAIPGNRTTLGENQPHADVVSPRGVVPEVGAAQGPSPLGSTR